mgnify:FL=1|tara:strand:+ start:176 stop:412 length:237 start_codon:yes stop_codon:yes gene_type:complete
MKRKADFYDHDKGGNRIDYTVEFTVTPYDKGDYYQPPSGGEVRDIRVYKTELMESGDVTNELDKMIDEAIKKEIERHN